MIQVYDESVHTPESLVGRIVVQYTRLPGTGGSAKKELPYVRDGYRITKAAGGRLYVEAVGGSEPKQFVMADTVAMVCDTLPELASIVREFGEFIASVAVAEGQFRGKMLALVGAPAAAEPEAPRARKRVRA